MKNFMNNIMDYIFYIKFYKRTTGILLTKILCKILQQFCRTLLQMFSLEKNFTESKFPEIEKNLPLFFSK